VKEKTKLRKDVAIRCKQRMEPEALGRLRPCSSPKPLTAGTPETQDAADGPLAGDAIAGQYDRVTGIPACKGDHEENLIGAGCQNVTRRMRLHWRMVVPVALFCALAACGGPSWPWHSAEIKPGQPDYPVLNHHPTDFIQITAHIPPTLKVAFHYGFSASPNAGGTISSGKSCEREIGLAVTAPIYINASLPLARSSDGTYHGTVAADRFEPGICDWRFTGISAITVNPPSPAGLLVRFRDDSSSPRGVSSDVWCMRDSHPLNPRVPEECGDLLFLSKIQKLVPTQLLSSVPQSERASSQVTIGRNTKIINVTFHDLNNLQSTNNRSIK
jgi:hypothetical protein